MMEKNAKIYVAGHRGMVGSAIVRELQRQGYTNIITRTHKELDLCRQQDVEEFFAAEKPEYVFLGRGQGRRHRRQSGGPGRFHVLQHDARDERHPLRLAERLQEAGVPRLVLHLPPHGAPAHAGKLPADFSELEKTNEAYALAKISGLKYCEFLNRQYGTDYISRHAHQPLRPQR